MSDVVVVTCFKRKGDRSGDSFINGGGNSIAEWELLKSDAMLKSLKCEFQLVEYDDIRALSNGYDKKIDTALYLDVRYGDDYSGSLVYNFALIATHIAAFVTEFAKKYHTSTAVVVHVNSPRTANLEVVTTSTEIAIVPTQETPFVKSWKLPAVVVGGFMFLVLIAGAIAFFDWRRRKGSTLQNLTPFFLSDVPEKSPHVNFAQVKQQKAEKGLLNTSEEGDEL